MVDIAQIQRGAAKFIDAEFLPHFGDFKSKLIVGGVTALFLEGLPNMLQQYMAHPMVAALNIVHDGKIDIDAVYNAFVPRMGTERLDFTLPVIGKIYMSKEDMDRLYECIKGA